MVSESTALSAASSADTRSSKLETTISAVFYEEGGVLKKYRQQPNVSLKVNDQINFDEMEGTTFVFPGKVLFYSLNVTNKNESAFQNFADTIHANRILTIAPTFK